MSTSATSGYDIVFLSDLLYFDDSHGALITSLTSLLSKSCTSRAYIAAGAYTLPHVCDNFLTEGIRAGLTFVEGPSCAGGSGNADDAVWLGKLEVSGLNKDQLAVRKAMCRWWVCRWAQS